MCTLTAISVFINGFGGCQLGSAGLSGRTEWGIQRALVFAEKQHESKGLGLECEREAEVKLTARRQS